MKRRNWLIAILGVMMSIFLVLGACAGNNEEKKLTLSKSELEMAQYSTEQLDAFLGDEKATDTVEWSSSNPAICTVEKGLVTAYKSGAATVTAKSGEEEASCKVTIEKVDELPSITLTQTSVEIRMGTELTVGASATFKGVAITPTYTWSSEDESIATVDQNGKITGIAYGNTTVMVKAEYMGATSVASIDVMVKTEFDVVYSNYSVVLKSDENVDPDEINYALTLDIFQEGEAYTGDKTITYSVEDESVAEVSQNGLVSAIAPGETRVVAEIVIGNYTLTDYINVTVEKSRKVFDLQDYELYNGYINGVAQWNRFTSDVHLYDDEMATITFQHGEEEPEESSAMRVGDEIIVSGTFFGAKAYGEAVLTVSLEKVDLVYPINVITKRISSLDDLKNMPIYGGIDSVNDTKYQYSGYFVLTQNIDCNYETLGVRGGYNTKEADSSNTDYGFDGVFDGRGYCIENMITDDGGLFGNVQKTAVIKNLAITGNITKNNIGLLGVKVNGSLENLYVKTSVATGLEKSGGLARYLGYAVLKDVVIVVDASKAADPTGNGVQNWSLHGYLAQQVGFASQKDGQIIILSYTLPKVSNVHVFVKNNDSATKEVAMSAMYASLYPDSVKNGITEYSYNAAANVTMTDNTYWTTKDGQPIFTSVPQSSVETASTAYEVYSSISNNALVANNLTINLAKYDVASIDKVTLKGERNAKTVSAYEFKNNVLTISGNEFGASIYGDTEVFIVAGTERISYKMTVVTKYINSIDDMKNLGIYGGVDANDSTGLYSYDGYFLLTKTLDNKNAGYNQLNFKFNMNGVKLVNKGEAGSVWNSSFGGFKGIFDGQGYSIKNLWFNYERSGGLFGNVDKDGVVKNLGVHGTPRFTTNNSWESGYLLAHSFLGTLQNCYIEKVELSASGDIKAMSTIASHTSYMQATDVVIKCDQSRSKSGYIAGTLALVSGSKVYGGPTFSNVHAFVQESTDSLYPSGGGDTYDSAFTAAGVYNGLTKHGYTDEYTTFTVSSTSEAKYWTTKDSQPIFASML